MSFSTFALFFNTWKGGERGKTAKKTAANCCRRKDIRGKFRSFPEKMLHL